MAAEVRTLSGDSTTIPDEKLEELRMGFHGPVITPADDEYDLARVVHNGMFDRRPGLIIACQSTGDVIDAVNLARQLDLLVAVRGGGHGIAGHCICDDGLLIDLSPMRGVWVDADSRTVRAQAGATWGDVDRESQVFGLAVPGGVVSTTGVAGLTLGGGLGWLHRKHGLTIDSLRSVELVTAAGELLRASDSENEELFWALRGGGGNFGVATAFEFDAHPLGPEVMFGAAVYAAADAGDVFRAWRDWASTVPDEITTRTVFWSMPEDPHLPPAVHNQDVLIVGALYAGPPDEGEAAVQPMRELATPLADMSSRMPYRMVQGMFDPFFPKGEILSYWKSVFLGELRDDAADIIVKRGNDRPHPLTLLHVPLMGGAASRVRAEDTAFGDRSAPWMVSVDGNWLDPGDNEANTQWVRDVISEAQALSSATGTYLNFSGDTEIDEAQRMAAFGANIDRLRRVKRQYDPENRFRLNNNIPPE